MRIELARAITAPSAGAFAVVADVARWPRIIRSVRRLEVLTPGPLRAGSRLREERVLFHRNGTHQYEVAAIEPPHRLRLLAQHPDLPYELDHIIDAVTGGGSRLTLVFRSRPETTAVRSLEPLISPLIWIILRDELEQDLSDFAAAISREQGHTSVKTSPVGD